MSVFAARLSEFRRRMDEAGIDVALITDDDNVYYLTGYYDYLHMEFGRPTILIVPRDGKSLLITPSIDANAAHAHAEVDRIAAWNDGVGDEWREEIPGGLDGAEVIDATGLIAMPGGIDSHVHISQPSGPGIEMADDFTSGTRSAACGGNTAATVIEPEPDPAHELPVPEGPITILTQVHRDAVVAA